jgi:hypothetical protein
LTYFLASADLALDSKEPGCEPSHSASRTTTAGASSPDIGQPCPVIQMSAASPQLDLLPMESTASTLSAAASPAKTSASLALVLALQEQDQGCGASSRDSLASYDPATSSWRTSQLCLSGEWEMYSETWPESGMTRSGQLFPRAPWGHHMCDDECSLWPTPTASMDGRGFGIPMHDRTGRYKKSTVSRVHALVGEHGWRIHPRFTEALMGFPMGWSAIELSETPSPQMSRKQSGGQS